MFRILDAFTHEAITLGLQRIWDAVTFNVVCRDAPGVTMFNPTSPAGP